MTLTIYSLNKLSKAKILDKIFSYLYDNYSMMKSTPQEKLLALAE